MVGEHTRQVDDETQGYAIDLVERTLERMWKVIDSAAVPGATSEDVHGFIRGILLDQWDAVLFEWDMETDKYHD